MPKSYDSSIRRIFMLGSTLWLNSNRSEANHLDAVTHDPEKPVWDTTREKWLQKYAGRMLAVWSQWQTPLGVARAYTDKIRTDLCLSCADLAHLVFLPSGDSAVIPTCE